MGKKITMKNLQEKTFRDVYDDFVIAKTARGVTEYTIRNYRHHFKSIEKYIDVDTMPSWRQRAFIRKVLRVQA